MNVYVLIRGKVSRHSPHLGNSCMRGELVAIGVLIRGGEQVS